MFEQEEKIKQAFIAKFPSFGPSFQILRERRISIEVSPAEFRAVFEYLIRGFAFGHLCTITGLDEGVNVSAIYHLAHENGIMVNIKTSVPKERPVLPTVTDIFSSADAYERELIDLLGFQIEGLPKGNRYPLPDGWPQGEYPLRKDWKSTTSEPIGQKPCPLV